MDALMGLLWLLAAWLGGVDRDPECLVLGGLDAVRTEAFVTGDVSLLSHVYADDRVAKADVAMLRSYRERGLRLEGMAMLRESCRVTDRSPGRVVLDVVDRLGPTAARTGDGKRLELPTDRPTRRTVVMHEIDDAWRIAEVRSR
jgi:hypothetical protein